MSISASFMSSRQNWASVSGIAGIKQDNDLIITSHFSDLGDGAHKGTAQDPRVSVIEVIPNEIRYRVATSGE
jgi:hypothetical protein